MVGRKGYLKTLEAVLAIVIILMFTFAVTPKEEPDLSTPDNVKASQDFILSEIQKNDSIRTLIMGSDQSDLSFNTAYQAIDQVMQDNVPPGYRYTFGLCGLSSCVSNITTLSLETSIYANDILISSNGSVQNPKVIRLWMWRAL